VRPRSTRHCAILATLAGAVVLATLLELKLEVVPPPAAEIALGVALLVLYVALIGAIPRAAAHAAPRDDRFSVLTRLGVSEYAALLLSHDPSFSIDDLRRLLARGCPLPTALRILWPA
jgi:hypothetical protein